MFLHNSYHVVTCSYRVELKIPKYFSYDDTLTVLKSWPTFVFQLTKRHIVFLGISVTCLPLGKESEPPAPFGSLSQ